VAEPKTFASLSSGLLARKGAAKPAMRPQGFGQVGLGVGTEDLGWNDMGHAPHAPAPAYAPEELPEHVPSSIAALTPAPRAHVEPVQEVEAEEEVAPPPVVEQQRAIEATFAEPAKPAPAPSVTASVVPLLPRERRAPGTKAKAAFTLRLDAERHLKLRLACAVTHRSAQQLVTEALDQFLATRPELDALSSSVAAKAGKRN
jgi:predicted transcriptional regulator